MSLQEEQTVTVSVVNAPGAPASVDAIGALPQCPLLIHVKQYPLFNATTEVVFSIPFTRKSYDSVKPVLKHVAQTQPIKIVVEKTGLVADSTLSKIDRFVPLLRTLEVRDLTDPITIPINKAVEGAVNTAGQVNDTFHKIIVDPTVKVATDLMFKFTFQSQDTETEQATNDNITTTDNTAVAGSTSVVVGASAPN